jgi:hypothetical protein
MDLARQVVLRGLVYDFTTFVDAHPGGARAVLRHAGTDATAVFEELHSESIFTAYAPAHLVGALAGARAPAAAPPPRASAADRPHVGIRGLGSPFPAERFDGTGLETVRFVLADAGRLLGGGHLASGRPPPARVALAQVHRQKSNLSLLDAARDWLHVGAPAAYAADMAVRERLVRGYSERVYVGSAEAWRAETVAAEQEVLEAVLAFVLERYPSRFERRGADTVATTTPGYERAFRVADFVDQPLRLAALLVQEDFFLMRESDAAEPTPLPAGVPGRAADDYDRRDFAEDHPTGRQHVLEAACSCFSFDARTKHMQVGDTRVRPQCRPAGGPRTMRGADISRRSTAQSMATIHHPGVGGWRLQLQRAMNRLYTDMRHETSWSAP